MSDRVDSRPAGPATRKPEDETPRREALDLRGIRCPLSWAKTKVHLETLKRGDELTVVLDDARGIRDLPQAAEAEGYAVGEPRAEGGCWIVTITV